MYKTLEVYFVACYNSKGKIMEQKIGYLLKNINDHMKTRGDADLKEHNLTLSQSRILAILYYKGGKTTQKQLEDELLVSHPTVVGLIKRLASHHFVNVSIDTKDHRNRIISLTPQGKKLASNMTKVINKQEEIILKGIDNESRQKLKDMLEIILSNID